MKILKIYYNNKKFKLICKIYNKWKIIYLKKYSKYLLLSIKFKGIIKNNRKYERKKSK